MAAIVSMGSLYFNGQAKAVGVSYNGETISFGDSVPGKEIQWVNANGLLIADRCLCTNISWEQLDTQGLVFGTMVCLNDCWYICRCLKVGTEVGDPNEWDAALDATNETHELWHWKNNYFWGQERPNADSSYRALRGYYLARYWYNHSASFRCVNLGFRPALEPLGSEPCAPDSLIGKETRIYGPGWAALEGCLLDADDYDLILRPTSIASEGYPWARWDGSQLTIDRASVSWLKEA